MSLGGKYIGLEERKLRRKIERLRNRQSVIVKEWKEISKQVTELNEKIDNKYTVKHNSIEEYFQSVVLNDVV